MLFISVKSMFGQDVADYAMSKFRSAVTSGDMRAFKIRLMFMKVREHLRGSSLFSDFVAGMGSAIDESEKRAGCIPDNSPRRMSHFEQARKKRIEEKKRSYLATQMELALTWPGTLDAKNQYIETQEIETGKTCDGNEENESIDKNDHVTVTRKNVPGESLAICGGARYSDVDQILSGIEDGEIEQYQSVEDICSEMKGGNITAVDALMLACALDIYSPVPTEDMESENDFECGDWEDEDMEDDDEDEEHEFRRSGSYRGDDDYYDED